MKKLFSIVLMMFCVLTISAQTDVTTFLGIPVDGFKADMRKKLIAKGFTPTTYKEDVLEGEFNGHDVYVHIVTNNNKVYRIMLADRNGTDEAQIKIRFNNLCYQFEKNERYSSEDMTIPEDEDISYEMSVHDKIYEAIFFQKSVLPTGLILTEDDAKAAAKKMTEAMLKKPVWFRIGETAGQYYIYMYYDNEYNKANGEDL